MERITNSAQLRHRIAELEIIKNLQEREIKLNVKELVHSLSPKELIKAGMEKITGSEDGGGSMVSNAGFSILSRILGAKSKSIGGAVKSTIAVQLIKLLYNRNEEKINDVLGNIGSKVSHWLRDKADKMKDDSENDEEVVRKIY